MARSLVIVESPAKASTLGKFLGKDFQVAACYGHVRDLEKKGIAVDRAKNYEPHVPHRPRQGEDGRRPRAARPQGRPHLPRRRPRPRGRGHLLAPARAAEEGGAEGQVPPRRVPRDHEVGGHPRDREAREDLEGPGGRAAGPAHHRPAGRLRGLGAALEQRLARPLRRARADGRAADHRGARDRARGLRGRAVLLGPGDAREGRRRLPRARGGLAGRQAPVRRHRPAPRHERGRRGGEGARRRLRPARRVGRGPRAAPEPGAALHDVRSCSRRRPARSASRSARP